MIIPNICENKKCSKPPTSDFAVFVHVYTWGWSSFNWTSFSGLHIPSQAASNRNATDISEMHSLQTVQQSAHMHEGVWYFHIPRLQFFVGSNCSTTCKQLDLWDWVRMFGQTHMIYGFFLQWLSPCMWMWLFERCGPLLRGLAVYKSTPGSTQSRP